MRELFSGNKSTLARSTLLTAAEVPIATHFYDSIKIKNVVLMDELKRKLNYECRERGKREGGTQFFCFIGYWKRTHEESR